MKGYMTLNTRAMNHMTRAAVFLLSWCAGGVSYAVDFPSQPLQTGVVQPAPNVIFILDDSLSMTSNVGLAGYGPTRTHAGLVRLRCAVP